MTELDTKQRIQKAAHDLVMQYSIRSVSMDDIAANLGMSKKTIYQYFKDKDELVESVVDEVIDTMQKVGNEIHHTLRCTNLGGLSVTPAAKEIEGRLNEHAKTFFKVC